MTGTRWSTADLLDLEFLIQQDECEEPARLAARDREIHARLAAPGAADAELIRHWLTCRRQEAEKGGLALPGGLWRELLLVLLAALIIAGLASGAGLAFSVLAYGGSAPVNVAVYFAVFVLVQLALYLFLAGSVLCSRILGGSILTTSLLYRLAGRLVFGLLRRLAEQAWRKTSARIAPETRMSWAAQLGSFKTFRQRHGLLLLRPFFLLAQMFGISFNLGVLAATLLKVAGADLAFGWQTTLQISAAAVHSLVRWISAPWSWLAPDCVPTPEQIEGSRLILKDGIYHLASRDLASWWPFLCLSVLCYGLLPRLTLLASGLIRQRLGLARLDCSQGSLRQIAHRMRVPLIATAAAPEKRPAASALPDKGLADFESSLPAGAQAPPALALIPDELFAACPVALLAGPVRQRAGYQLRQTLAFWTLDKSTAEELEAIQQAMTAQACKDLLIVHEAWQPPVQELLAWLGLLRRALGTQPAITLALIGRPEADSVLTPPQPQHLRVWRQKLAALGDPGLHLIPLVP